MSLHFPSNKPRSIHRQLPRYSAPGTVNAPIPPSLEQSLDEWLSRTGSNNSASSDVSSDLATYGNNYNHCLTQSTISTSPPTYTSSSELQQPTYPCLCCQLPQCTAWKKIIKVTRKLETETRLAAEIGQSLLQTNEAYKVELDKLKDQMKHCDEQKHAVELSLDDAERLARQLEHEKDKWMWKYEKSQMILDESAADLETAHSKCAALTKDIEHLKLEIDKLQHLKVKSYQFGTRQDILESKLQDMKQELGVSRKDKLALESKYKKLTTQFETLSCAYQEILKESPKRKLNDVPAKPLSSITPPTATDIEQAGIDEVVAFVKELVSTNNELKSELLATSTQLNDMRNEINSPEDKSPSLNNGESQKSIGTTSNYANRASATSNRLEQRSTINDRRPTPQKTTTAKATATSTATKTRLRSASVRVSKSKSTRETRRASSSSKGIAVSPRTTTSSPVIHHHYHYYGDVRQQNTTNAINKMDATGNPILAENIDKPAPVLNHAKTHTLDVEVKTTTTKTIHHIDKASPTAATPIKDSTINTITQPTHKLTDNMDTNSPPKEPQQRVDNLLHGDLEAHASSDAPTSTPVASSLSPADKDNNTTPATTKEPTTTTTIAPYAALLNQAKAILHRIRATDPRVINRRLQRAFDIGELSNMSNSLLQNIMADVDTMYARFFWLPPDENDDGDCAGGDGVDRTSKNSEFLPMVQLFQEILHELGQLSITINHLQVAYVEKIQKTEIQADQGLQEPPPALSATEAVGSNDSPTPLPSLMPSGNTSCISSSSTESLASFTNHNDNTATTSHWLSPLFIGSNNTLTSLDSSNSRSRGEDPVRPKVPLKNNNKHPPNSTIRHLRRRRRQQHNSSRFDHNKHQLWPSVSLMMDAWNQRPLMDNTSSFLDREWHWFCSDSFH